MTLLRLWWPLLAAVVLSACSNLPSAPAAGAASSDKDSPYALRSARSGAPALVPGAPLSELTTSAVPGPGLRAVAATSAPTDLWERIRRGFLMPDLDNDLVHDREQWYTERPDYFERMTERGRKYLYYIVEELERRNMPTELALLPFVESAYNPQAVSSARAAGMWQFMPQTGKDFDLKQNMFRDDRRDVLASTRAALDYLEQLHDQFGDWQLALAAYNWGQGSVSKAIKRNQGQGLGTSYSELTMPNETRNYVPKLQAVKNIVAHPERFSAALPKIGNHPFFDAVPIKRDMDVSKVAELAGVSEKDFRQLNPSANKPVILAAATPSVLLPWDNAQAFEEKLTTYSGPLSSWTAWIAPRDMTVAQAAAAHNVSEEEFRSINNIPPRMLIKSGSTVLVPRGGKLDADVPGHLADNGKLLLQQEIQLVRKTVKALKGETVTKLANRLHLSAARVAEWNKLREDSPLKPGQPVAIMTAERVGSKVPAEHTSKAPAPSRKTATVASNVSKAKVAPRASKAPARKKP